MKVMKNQASPSVTDALPYALVKCKTSVRGLMSSMAKYKSMTCAQEVA
ncbi:hypothetical protein QF025_001219 [Paraburkholderia graminis]|uniref:Uncharacterized protein n=1 Tax=Paraburkholderia graminis TaxID=60548 RepID=A0ABD5CF70_9BURK|nr:hypothetical protein [Paraburkholderia graminis]